jgi:hypothetical protein
LKRPSRDEVGDITTAFLIGAFFGVAATLLLRVAPPARKPSGLERRLRRLRDIDLDIRTALAALRDR